MGDVYRPENAPGFVFEEVTVAATGQTLDGPLGPIEGGIDRRRAAHRRRPEEKIFAPGYGEFLTGGGGDIEALALAVPTDATSEPRAGGSGRDLERRAGGRRCGRRRRLDCCLVCHWRTSSSPGTQYRGGDVPRLIEPLLTDTLDRLDRCGRRPDDPTEAQQLAIEVARLGYDLQLRYRSVVEVDLLRLDLWAVELTLDVEAGDAAAVGADHYAIDIIRDRVTHALSAADRAAVNEAVGAIQIAVVDEEMDAAAEAAGALRDALAGIEAAP